MTNVEAFLALLDEIPDVPAEVAALGLTIAADIDAGVGTQRGVNAALVSRYVELLEGLRPSAEDEEADPKADMLADLRDRKASGAA